MSYEAWLRGKISECNEVLDRPEHDPRRISGKTRTLVAGRRNGLADALRAYLDLRTPEAARELQEQAENLEAHGQYSAAAKLYEQADDIIRAAR